MVLGLREDEEDVGNAAFDYLRQLTLLIQNTAEDKGKGI